MECNKEEAIRAKELAEKKMGAGDFFGAQKLVMKAQRLFPDLENISQLIAICDVHSSAQKKINGLENWYGILQVEHFADEAMIRKQYRKLALLLHPDKNKFVGAEAAFKLVGEASRLLTDQMKRSQYDIKYRVFSQGFVTRPGNNQSNMNSGRHYAAANNVTSSAGNRKTSHLTFWTCCQFCKYRYKYLREYVNTLMFCSKCQKSYIAFDIGSDVAPPGPTSGQFPSQKDIPIQGSSGTPLQNNSAKPAGACPTEKSMSSGQTQRSGSAAAEIRKNAMREEKLNEKYKGVQKNEAEVSKPEKDVGGQENDANVPPKPQSEVSNSETGATKPAADGTTPEPDVPKAEENAPSKSEGQAKRKAVEDSSKSFEFNGCHDCGKEEVVQEKVGAEMDIDGSNMRRSSRKKQQVSYAEDGSDDDFVSPPSKKTKSHKASDFDGQMKGAASAGRLSENAKYGSSAASADAYKEKAAEKVDSMFEDLSSSKDKQGKWCKANGEEAVRSSNVDGVDNVCEANENPEMMTSPDPEFNDFDKATDSFAVNQVWAIYDPIDGMPRFYAQIRKVFAPSFRVRMTWLEPQLVLPGKKIEYEIDESIPIACGKFKTGDTEEIEDNLMFSHQMHYFRYGRNTIAIYPKKGEIWALFRDWDVSWSTEPEKHKPPYKYDFVEVVSDYSDHLGIGVAYLGKIKGFVSLFRRAEQHGVIAFSIPPGEMNRFSHNAPSFKMTGNEKEGVPAGSFELDPAALPNDISEIGPTDDASELDKQNPNGRADVCCSNAPEVEVKNKAGPERVHTPQKRQKTQTDEASSPWKVSDGIYGNQDQVHTSQSSGPEVEFATGKGHDSSSCQVDETSRQKKSEKVSLPVDALKLRRSPRALSQKNNQVDSGQQKAEGSCQQKKYEDDGVSVQSNGDGLLANKMNTPKKLEKDLAAEALRLRRSPRGSKKTDVQLHGTQSTAENSWKYSNPKEHERSDEHLTRSSSPNGVKKSSKLDAARVSSSCRTWQEHSGFKDKNSEDKFQVDQIWALRNRANSMPTDYAQIKKIETTPEFRLHVVFLEPCPLPKNSTRPICCGVFKLKTEKAKVVPRKIFSHQLNAVEVEKNKFQVYPRKGEIWALRKNSSSSASVSSDASEHDIVEVVEDNSQVRKVAVLTGNTSESLYRAQRGQSSAAGIINIPRSEVARFSHQIPAIRHQTRKDQHGVVWELDPSAIPRLTIVLD